MVSRYGSQALAEADADSAGFGTRSCFWRGVCLSRVGGVTSLAGFASLRVGGHLVGRFCRRSPSPCSRWPHRDPGRFQIGACRFPTHTGGLLDAPQRPAQPSQRDDLLFLLFAQDIAHGDGGYSLSSRSMSRALLSLAGFQVTLIGRFWVTAEAR